MPARWLGFKKAKTRCPAWRSFERVYAARWRRIRQFDDGSAQANGRPSDHERPPNLARASRQRDFLRECRRWLALLTLPPPPPLVSAVRQAVDNWRRLAFRQTTMRSASGTNSLHSRITSPVHLSAASEACAMAGRAPATASNRVSTPAAA